MKITPASLLAAIDRRRLALAQERGDAEPIPYAEVAEAIGAHPAMLSRIRRGGMPSSSNLLALTEWLEGEDPTCSECAGGGEALDSAAATESGAQMQDDTEAVTVITGSGSLSSSDDPETRAAVARVRELLIEGAVGLSVALDLHPDDAQIIAEAEWDEDRGELDLPEGFVPRLRIRHSAIVDTPAYADMRLALVPADDGSDSLAVAGTLVVEGYGTGDLRVVHAEQIDLDASTLPHPIIWDREEGDHTGMTVGYIDHLERVSARVDGSARVVLDDEAITAALAPLEMPASFFAQTMPTGPEPLRISEPDANGYRAIRGLAAPAGTCLRQATTCWTWPGDKDKTHRHFHTGTLLRLDDGRDIRVGALTIGGAHLDGALARQGVTAADASNHRDNANRVFALVRVWETRFGLMLAGVIPPDVTAGDVTRGLACSPSIEFWPDGGGRTLIGLHLVPTPALPVLASAGVAEHYVTDTPITLDGEAASAILGEVEFDLSPLTDALDAMTAQLDAMTAQLATLEATTSTILALTPIDALEIV